MEGAGISSDFKMVSFLRVVFLPSFKEVGLKAFAGAFHVFKRFDFLLQGCKVDQRF